MKTSRIVAAGLAAIALPLFALNASPAVANSSEAAASTNWLAQQLKDDGLLHTEFGPEYGLSADALVALSALGGQSSAVNALAAGLSADPQAYISGEAFGDEGSTYAGATGKLIVALDAAGNDVTSVAGINLVERLESVIETENTDAGRGKDVSGWGDYSNGVGQSWIVRALAVGESSLADEALNYTLGKQCDDGGFPTDLNAQACNSGHDTTAFTIAALLEARAANVGDSVAIDAAVTAAANSLKAAQSSDGSFGAGDGINSNTTGLAAWALRSVGETEAADKAVDWVRTVFVKSAGSLSAEAGAIAFNTSAYSTAANAGSISSDALDQWLRATAQAALAWVDAPDAEVVPVIVVNAPTTATAGSEFLIEASGYPEGEVITIDLSLNGSAAGKSFAGFKLALLGTETADAAGAISHTAVAPSVTGDYTLSLISDSGVFTSPIVIAAADNGGTDTGNDDDTTSGGEEDVAPADNDAETAGLSRTDGSPMPVLIAAAVIVALAGGSATIYARRRRA